MQIDSIGDSMSQSQPFGSFDPDTQGASERLSVPKPGLVASSGLMLCSPSRGGGTWDRDEPRERGC